MYSAASYKYNIIYAQQLYLGIPVRAFDYEWRMFINSELTAEARPTRDQF